MDTANVLFQSSPLPEGVSGELLSVPREKAGWKWMSFYVRRLVGGASWEMQTDGEEVVLVLLGGRCAADWGQGERRIGERAHVFDGLPYAVYLPPQNRIRLRAETTCEVAECRVPASGRRDARLVTPQDVIVSMRGGGNASRQIVDVMNLDFPAERLIVVEVYTPSGNWSSFPPHKHGVHNPPSEVELDEIYYYRIDQPQGFACQRLYNPARQQDLALTVKDGDLVLVRDAYHPVVAGHGYNVYYLNFLAGSSHALAFTEDPDHSWVRSTWKNLDERLPVVGDKKTS